MAPAKTPRAKKAPAKRKTAKKPAARKVAPKIESPVDISPGQYDAQWHAKLEAYSALKAADVPIPDELAKEVDAWLGAQAEIEDLARLAQEAQDAKLQKANVEGPLWVRNLYNGPFSLRLERQEKKKRLELKPRGQRGDMHPLEPGDENDRILLTNLATGLIELVPNGVALEIAGKQTNNLQAVHTPLAILTNKLGENKGNMKLKVEQEFNEQGVVVAYTNPQAAKNAPLGGLVRPGQAEQVSHFVPTGGQAAVVQSGFTPQLSDEAKARISDDIARRKGVQGRPEDVLGLSVSLAPTQRV